MYSQMASDFAVHSTRFGDFWEHDIYDNISPHYLAGDFHTPALIIHGQLDYRVPVGQSFEIFRTLRHKGIDARLIYYPDENHWILKPNNSLYWYDQVRTWIGEYAAPGGN
jgi:dipeptidyl aminopeptidase/acylaminoacyl peptidase